MRPVPRVTSFHNNLSCAPAVIPPYCIMIECGIRAQNMTSAVLAYSMAIRAVVSIQNQSSQSPYSCTRLGSQLSRCTRTVLLLCQCCPANDSGFTTIIVTYKGLLQSFQIKGNYSSSFSLTGTMLTTTQYYGPKSLPSWM